MSVRSQGILSSCAGYIHRDADGGVVLARTSLFQLLGGACQQKYAFYLLV